MGNSTLWPAASFGAGSMTGTRAGALVYLVAVFLIAVVAFTAPACSSFRRAWLPRRRRCPWSLIQPVVIGLVASLWLHFIPCIWWTCDWSSSDGAAVRGGIWFIGWLVIGVGMLVANCCATESKQEHDAAGWQAHT